ncbi:MAG TPA: DUF4339 domain-containing protein [Chthoniobacterales bacterium]|nr:DUF4339 domain-containing protein [Chthoniobacterales bacterium]
MNVFIARDGTVIGEYPRAELSERARAGELEMEDHYWHEGMDDWLLLPELLGPDAWKAPLPPPPPANPMLILGGIGAALLAIGLIAFLFIKPDRSVERSAPMSAGAVSSPLGATAAHELRDKAAADLRQKIERLPARATPPLNTFYYDVRVNMNKTLSLEIPWSATIRGGENLVDPKTDETVRRTAFTLEADYKNGVWVYKRYRATASNMTEATTTDIEDDENSPTPPSIVGMLGLKTGRN